MRIFANIALKRCQDLASRAIYTKPCLTLVPYTRGRRVYSRQEKTLRTDAKPCLTVVPYTGGGRTDASHKETLRTTPTILKSMVLKTAIDEINKMGFPKTFSTTIQEILNHKIRKSFPMPQQVQYSHEFTVRPSNLNELGGAKSRNSLLLQPSKTRSQNSSNTFSKSSIPQAILAIRPISSDSTQPKTLHYNSPFVLELLGGHKFPMTCDTYRKAVIEADKRRAALRNKVEIKRPKDCIPNGPMIMKSPKYSIESVESLKLNEKVKEKEGFGKNQVDKLQKLMQNKEEGNENRVPSGCVSSKCIKEDPCAKLKKLGGGGSKKVQGLEREPKMATKATMPVLQMTKGSNTGPKGSKSGSSGGNKAGIGGPCNDCGSGDGKGKGKPDSNQSKSLSNHKDKGKSKKSGPCSDVEKEYKPKCNTTDPCDPVKQENPCSKKDEKKSNDPCAKYKNNPESDKKTIQKPSDPKVKSSDPCAKKDEKKKFNDPCSKKDQTKKSNDPCAKKKPKVDKKTTQKCLDPKAGEKPKTSDPQYPCAKDKTKLEKNKSDTRVTKKEEVKKNSPLCSGNKGPCAEKKDTHTRKTAGEKKMSKCCKKDTKKKDLCSKKPEKPNPCKKQQEKKPNPCNKKEESQKQDPCKKQPNNPCGKKPEPSGKSQKSGPCKKAPSDPCGKKPNPSEESQKPNPCKKSSNETCGKKTPTTGSGTKPRSTKPNCKTQGNETKKCFSTSAKNQSTFSNISSESQQKQLQGHIYSMNLSLKNRNFSCYGFMHRHYSSKGKRNNNEGKLDQGIRSKCKSFKTKKPPKRLNHNHQNKYGLRQCYPAYDMECPKKLCKNPQKTACNKSKYLKDTNNNKRNENSKKQWQLRI